MTWRIAVLVMCSLLPSVCPARAAAADADRVAPWFGSSMRMTSWSSVAADKAGDLGVPVIPLLSRAAREKLPVEVERRLEAIIRDAGRLTWHHDSAPLREAKTGNRVGFLGHWREGGLAARARGPCSATRSPTPACTPPAAGLRALLAQPYQSWLGRGFSSFTQSSLGSIADTSSRLVCRATPRGAAADRRLPSSARRKDESSTHCRATGVPIVTCKKRPRHESSCRTITSSRRATASRVAWNASSFPSRWTRVLWPRVSNS